MKIEVGRMIRELRPGEALTLQIPKRILNQGLDSEEISVIVKHETKNGRSCRLSIEAPKSVVISKP
jgi:hypothetical protein